MPAGGLSAGGQGDACCALGHSVGGAELRLQCPGCAPPPPTPPTHRSATLNPPKPYPPTLLPPHRRATPSCRSTSRSSSTTRSTSWWVAVDDPPLLLLTRCPPPHPTLTCPTAGVQPHPSPPQTIHCPCPRFAVQRPRARLRAHLPPGVLPACPEWAHGERGGPSPPLPAPVLACTACPQLPAPMLWAGVEAVMLAIARPPVAL